MKKENNSTMIQPARAQAPNWFVYTVDKPTNDHFSSYLREHGGRHDDSMGFDFHVTDLPGPVALRSVRWGDVDAFDRAKKDLQLKYRVYMQLGNDGPIFYWEKPSFSHAMPKTVLLVSSALDSNWLRGVAKDEKEKHRATEYLVLDDSEKSAMTHLLKRGFINEVHVYGGNFTEELVALIRLAEMRNIRVVSKNPAAMAEMKRITRAKAA